MKAAIYSRIMEEGQQHNVQVFFDELEKQSIEPVIFTPFYEQIKSHIRIPADTGFFSASEDLNADIEFII
ncbi:MAG TPA: hypothetical protein VJU78_13870, partial [Chitinophagaceae bacterium]|nr:hypothetical protein [Chitinophagaceae bacterium]